MTGWMWMWLALLIGFAVAEGSTAVLVSIWFCLGSFFALIAAAFNAPPWLQLTWFIIVSGSTLAALRPFAKKYMYSRKTTTNADRVFDSEAFVVENTGERSGTVRAADGKLWSARSEDGTVFEPGEKVRVLRIEGVKLIVAALEEAAII